MEIKFEIDNKLEDITIKVAAPSITEEVSNILKALEECKKEKIYATKNDEIYEINLKDIICIYTEDKGVYLKTDKGIFKIKYRMYELEENYLTDRFIRISNAVIVNMDHVKCFDTAEIGNIIVKLDNNTEEYVSKRRISVILKRLKEGSF